MAHVVPNESRIEQGDIILELDNRSVDRVGNLQRI